MVEALEQSFCVPAYLLQVLDDYLRVRALVNPILKGQRKMIVVSGAGRKSVLGPDLWNVGRTIDIAHLKLDRDKRNISRWMAQH